MVNGRGAPRVPCQESRSEAQLTAQSCSPASPPSGAAQSALPAELSGWPSCTLSETQLGDLELLTSGAFAPLRGYLNAAETAAVTEYGTLPDGTSWPVPVTLDVAADAVPADADRLVLQDQEGSPLAVLAITERLAMPGGDPGLVRLAGPVTALREPEHGPFRKLRRRPEDVRAELAGPAGEPTGESGAPSGGNVLAYATRRPLNRRHIGQLRYYAGQLNARLLVLPLVSGPDGGRAPARSPGPDDPGGPAASPGGHPRGPRPARAAYGEPASGRLIRSRPARGRRRLARPGHRRRGLRCHPPAGRLTRRHRPAVRSERHPDPAGGADPGHQRGRVGLRPALGGVAPARADRGGGRAGRADRFRARRAARFRRRGTRLVRSAERGP